MRDRNVVRERERQALALASVAGFVDTVGYLVLHHLFTAHMTGNASELGAALGRDDLGHVWPLIAAPLLFLAGVSIGTVLADAGESWIALALQGALILAFMGLGRSTVAHGPIPLSNHVAFYLLAAFSAVGFGMQTAALTEIDGVTVRTSYVTGILTNLGQNVVRRLAGRSPRRRPLLLLAGLWLLYVAGATLGSFALRHLTLWCLALPAVVVLVVAERDRGIGRSAPRGGEQPEPEPGSA